MTTYKIFHQFDIGDRSVFIESDSQPTMEIAYIHLMAFNLYNDTSLSLSNLSIANALVALFGCTSGARVEGAVPIDTHPLEFRYSLEELLKIKPELKRDDEVIRSHLNHHINDQ